MKKNNWKKLGRIFKAEGQKKWLYSHTATPIAFPIGNDKYRIYFSSRDSENHVYISSLELDIKDPQNILTLSENYILGPGPLGFFDDNGVYPGSIVKHENKLLMYYAGRHNGQSPLFYMSIGMAQSNDNGKSFQRLFNAPVMSRSEFDPWIVSTPEVMKKDGRWQMWYLSGFRWECTSQGVTSYYDIKYASSEDGIHWNRDGTVCIPLQGRETNISNPSVVYNQGDYNMWYSSVSKGRYRIGFAQSPDGRNWQRKDKEAGIDFSDHGWDSQGMAYPNVFVHKGRTMMLYSGNEFGKEGFGLAVKVDE
ncbi:MAG: hypothetical protein PF503_22745 [Desulfobacula sp.]|jgi:predicted GH43/DUF377 family glycosyl hydrolase|nr:hypothetical protein [Desulfobacula sp.]